MAHPCFSCGGECYCSGDIDDIICCHTPSNCDGCGCELCESYSDDDDDFDDDDDDFNCCSDCDLPDACADFGCAIQQGLRLPDNIL